MTKNTAKYPDTGKKSAKRSRYSFREKLVRVAMNRILGTVAGVATGEKVAALTFDDGPHPEHTPRLLEVLERHGAKGTFFMLGEMAERHPEIVRRVIDGGHAVGNHTWDHPSMPRISSAERRRQIRRCAAVTRSDGPRLFRPPYGHQNLASRLDSLRMGYQVIGWTAHVEDWCRQSPEELANRLRTKNGPGAILLLHDALNDVRDAGAVDRDFCIRGLDLFLKEAGGDYRFLTIPELLKRGPVKRKLWNKEGDEAWVEGCTTRWAEAYTQTE